MTPGHDNTLGPPRTDNPLVGFTREIRINNLSTINGNVNLRQIAVHPLQRQLGGRERDAPTR